MDGLVPVVPVVPLVPLAPEWPPRAPPTARGSPSKTVIALFAASQAAALFLEVRHTDGRECRSSMVFGLILVNLVNGDSGMNDGWLDGLFLDDWLDSLGECR